MIKFEFSDDKNIIQKFKFILSLGKKDDSDILYITNETDLQIIKIMMLLKKNYLNIIIQFFYIFLKKFVKIKIKLIKI